MSLLIAFFMAETIIRVWRVEQVFAWTAFSQSIVECVSSFNPYSGWRSWLLRQGANKDRPPVTILPNGMRSNGNKPPKPDKPVLAV
jgi:hypothetical protein